ncbi:hypothetical protein GK047_02560 [Paenibacillus sp. SYP-B3998]|uniref:Uncharacterized protein n=1 Tax=Paenibacillus sp. SYP-B3998 TaxID=2678564 RepID=A0A6G3ZTI0_9BACL|nr:hypothetical protein [Paenibacillus sp. SYP-B3998]NEW04899.1 hypothetical protein [Paenibacillus sp. SYP-B3998]
MENRNKRAIQINCPERYCFFWLDEGTCGCPFGTCFRIEEDNKNRDMSQMNQSMTRLGFLTIISIKTINKTWISLNEWAE